MRSDIARASVEADGTGVMVGTISDSYNCFGNAADGVASGDLPAGTLVIEEGPCIGMAMDEGRAMMEVITDIAPGVRHAFATAHWGQANFAKNILALAGVGADIINDDITYLFEPFYQDGVIAQAVDLVKARGVSYFSAAGNDGRQSYETPFRPSGEFVDEGHGRSELHDFVGAGSRYLHDVHPADRKLRAVGVSVGSTLLFGQRPARLGERHGSVARRHQPGDQRL
jgi:hypothetical protein